MAALKFSGDLLMKSVVSSAKASALASVRAYTIPWMFFERVILINRISTMMMNSCGDMMSPCGTPCSSWIGSVRLPPSKIWAVRLVKNVLIQLMISLTKLSVYFGLIYSEKINAKSMQGGKF